MVDKQPTQAELEVKRTQLLDEAKKLGWKPEDSSEFKGVIKDLNRERETRQQVQGQVTMLQEQVDILMQEKEKVVEDPAKDEEFLTRKEAKLLLDKATKDSTKEEQMREQRRLNDKFASDEADAKTKLTEEAKGVGLDYLSVLHEGYAKIIADNPAYKDVVLAAGQRGKNMAEEAYKIGLTHPDIQARIQSKKNLETLEDIDKHSKTSKAPATIESVMSMKQTTFEDLMTLSEDDLKASIRADEEKAQKKG